jgi:hypothetical protein
MTRKEIVKLCLLDACRGQPQSLAGLLDYLTEDCGIDLERIIEIGSRQFGIPTLAGWGAVYDIRPVLVQ